MAFVPICGNALVSVPNMPIFVRIGDWVCPFAAQNLSTRSPFLPVTHSLPFSMQRIHMNIANLATPVLTDFSRRLKQNNIYSKVLGRAKSSQQFSGRLPSHSKWRPRRPFPTLTWPWPSIGNIFNNSFPNETSHLCVFSRFDRSEMLVRLRDALRLSISQGIIDQFRVSSLTAQNLRRNAGQILTEFMDLHQRSCVVGARLDSSFSDFNRLSVRVILEGSFKLTNLSFVVSLLDSVPLPLPNRLTQHIHRPRVPSPS